MNTHCFNVSQVLPKFVNVYVHEHEKSRAKADRLKGDGFNLEGD